MTTEEAKQKIDECEKKITSAHSTLCDSARGMGSSALQAIEAENKKKTLMPLIACAIGFICMLIGHPVFGVLFIIGGLVASYNARSKAKAAKEQVETAIRMMNSAIDKNSNI